MIDYLQAGVLGGIQGLTEFLPISSSGHLIIVPGILGWEDQGLAFDIAMHLATLLAVFLYFYSDWKNLYLSLRAKNQTREVKQAKHLLRLIGISMIPAVLAGLFIADFAETVARNPLSVAGRMIFAGLIFLLVERISSSHKDLGKLTGVGALAIGVAQAAAILPGISRAGATIATGIYQGLKREAAARFSFLMSGPIILIAAAYYVLKLFTTSEPLSFTWPVLLTGFAASLVMGLLAIKFMMYFLKNHRLNIFAYYLIALGLTVIVLNLFHVRIF